MAGGIVILLIVIVVVMGGAIAFFLYGTGGALALRSDRPRERRGRPQHTEPTTPAQEHTRFVGAEPDANATERDEPEPPPSR